MLGIKIIKPTIERLAAPNTAMVEFCGRVSRRTEDRKTRGYEFIKKWGIKHGHESMLENASATYLITCSRSASHQICRHRHLSIVQESQRYCDYSPKSTSETQYLRVILPDSIKKLNRNTKFALGDEVKLAGTGQPAFLAWLIAARSSYHAYCVLRHAKTLPEDARSVLPNCTATKLTITANLRAWRDVIKIRALNKHAQKEIKDIFLSILGDLAWVSPACFGDLEEIANERKEKLTLDEKAQDHQDTPT